MDFEITGCTIASPVCMLESSRRGLHSATKSLLSSLPIQDTAWTRVRVPAAVENELAIDHDVLDSG